MYGKFQMHITPLGRNVRVPRVWSVVDGGPLQGAMSDPTLFVDIKYSTNSIIYLHDKLLATLFS